MRRMTQQEIEFYKKQVDRRGNALKQTEEVREKYKAEFEKINAHLENNWKWFMVSNTVRHNRYADRAIWNELVEKEEHGLIAEAIRARNNGDFENFCWFCWLMHLKYMTMWKEKYDEKHAY